MPAEPMTEMLSRALSGKYAVGAFNILDASSMRAVVDAAEDLRAPIIVQTSVKTVRFWEPDMIAGWFEILARDADVPVALHLDHCGDEALIESCMIAGWTSVMFDGSRLGFEENAARTRAVAESARNYGVSIEAELGPIGSNGVPEDIFTDPDEAERFLLLTGIDCLAPAVGTAHGLYHGEPRIDFDRLGAIAARTGCPLALHGGTGLSDGDFRRAIDTGCAKINISTAIKLAFMEGCAGTDGLSLPGRDPIAVLDAQYDAVRAVVSAHIGLFGCAGKA